jgi:hypothetical protein
MTPAAAGVNDPKAFFNVSWQFKTTTDGPILAPFIPPQGIIRPGKDEVDMDLYVVWSGSGGSPTEKVGWIVSIAQILEGESIMKLAGALIDTPDLYRDDNGEVDWGLAGPPDEYQNYPYAQYGLAYEVGGAVDWAVHKTKVRSFKVVNGALVIDRDRRSFGKMAGTVNGLQVLSGLFIWRAVAGNPSASLPAAFGPGVFDVDGDGNLDTDDYASNDVYVWGVVGKFK